MSFDIVCVPAEFNPDLVTHAESQALEQGLYQNKIKRFNPKDTRKWHLNEILAQCAGRRFAATLKCVRFRNFMAIKHILEEQILKIKNISKTICDILNFC